MFGRSKRAAREEEATSSDGTRGHSMETDRTLTEGFTHDQVKRATRTRLIWTFICTFLLLLTWIFLILVEVAQTDRGFSTLTSIYFINVDLSDIFPVSVPNAAIVNSIAQTIGLHDFYRVGLWNFCEGYHDSRGVTHCSKPETLYWFDPVSIILSELLAGATITLPTDLTNDLDLIRIVSKWMFGLFLTGACMSFVMMFVQFVSVFSRWWAFVIMFFTFLTALFTCVATVVATVLFIILRNVLTSVAELNIGANLGNKMFAFMWIAAASSFLAFIIQLCLCCCCASRRDVRTGRKKGSKKAYTSDSLASNEKTAGKFDRKSIFGGRRNKA
ncbi:hypothetical protein AAFC00_004481 [Neodothiora populina]|uniref:SUR7 family protein pun1 n=1 Tax=Neodothiora populina TaxID=2781224 RepID=A0ABR3P264_9PEZI